MTPMRKTLKLAKCSYLPNTKSMLFFTIYLKKTMKGTSVNGSNYCTPNAIFLYFTHLETLNAVSDVSHDLTL